VVVFLQLGKSTQEPLSNSANGVGVRFSLVELVDHKLITKFGTIFIQY